MHNLEVDPKALGVSFEKSEGASVRLWAPNSRSVELILDDGTNVPMQKEDFGYWTCRCNQIQPGTRYGFSLDKGAPLPDPASLSQPEGVHALSEAIDLNRFTWTDGTWKNPPLENYILYELHTGTFTPEGTFDGIAAKLGHLRALGITAVEIMPVAQFPGTRNWGYDGVFPFAVQCSYGGATGLQNLVNTCHEQGMAVVLDVVYNHLGPEGNHLPKFGPYFTDKYKTPWGHAVNFDDAGCDETRRFFIENALMWFRDFHVDALRLDAVHAIRDFSPNHILARLREYTDKLMEETGRVHYFIIESDLNDTRFITSLKEKGCGMHAQWVDEFHHALRVTAGQEQTGYYSDFNGLPHLAKSYRDAYVYDGQYSHHRQKSFGTPASDISGKHFIVFSQNHDQVGNRMLGERTGTLHSLEMQKLLAGAVIVSPYVPLFFMGEEWGETNPFLYFVSHSDPELADAVRKGRQEEFKAFHQQGKAPDPNGPKTFERSKLQWELLQKEPHQHLFQYYRKLIRLRKTHPVLRIPDRDNLEVSHNESGKTLMLYRWQGKNRIACAMNFGKAPQHVELPTGDQAWETILDSASPEWMGPGSAPAPSGKNVTVHPESLIILSNCRV